MEHFKYFLALLGAGLPVLIFTGFAGHWPGTATLGFFIFQVLGAALLWLFDA